MHGETFYRAEFCFRLATETANIPVAQMTSYYTNCFFSSEYAHWEMSNKFLSSTKEHTHTLIKSQIEKK